MTLRNAAETLLARLDTLPDTSREPFRVEADALRAVLTRGPGRPAKIDDAELQRRHDAGESVADIAAALGCSTTTVRNRLKACELPPHPSEWRPTRDQIDIYCRHVRGETFSAIGSSYGRTKQWAYGVHAKVKQFLEKGAKK